MKISASIYSNPTKSIEEIVVELDSYHVDFLHVDCKDEMKVFDDIEKIRKISRTPIDLHIITEKPSKYYSKIKEHKIEFVCFQHENSNEKIIIPDDINSSIGIAIMNDTPVDIFDSYFKEGFAFGLLMTTTPGESGGSFNEKTYQRVTEFKKKYPTKALYVDGGVNDLVAAKLRDLKVDCSISGSYLLKAEELGVALSKLKSDIGGLHFKVTDFMIRINQLPIISSNDLTLSNVIETITKYKMAFCLITNDSNCLFGIITDGDLRREFLKNIDDLNKVSVENMLNKNPLYIHEESYVSDALEIIKKNNKQIMFLPIVDKKKQLLGVVSINQLIKGSL